jgi:arylsulfatase A-like enzyme
MTDDQTLAEMRALPRTRKLIGDEGVTFERFYATNPLCCPSRASFFTGQYSHNHGVISNEGSNAYPALREHHTLPVWLRRAGYDTAFAGKYLNGYGEEDREFIPPGWDSWRAIVEPTANEYYDYDVNDNGELVHYGSEPEDYKTTVIGEFAVDAIRDAAESDRPLFLYVGFNAPHAPSVPAPGDAGSFADLEPMTSEAFDEADVSDKPSFIRDRPRLDKDALARIESRRQNSLDSLRAVDREVARIVGELERQGELANTYVLFTSDNGYLAGEHRIEFGKLLAYEPSAKVPLLVRGPGIPEHARTKVLAGNIDLAPTLLDLADAKSTEEPDGRSLEFYLANPSRTDDRPLLIESLVRDKSTYYGHPYAAIRTKRYLYVEYTTGDKELYDLRNDPEQLTSHDADRAYAATKRALADALARLRQCSRNDCSRSVDSPPKPK